MTLAEALAKLHKAGRIKQSHLPGMLTDYGHVWGKARWPARKPASGCFVLTDPVTVGCLLALLRKASGDPRVRVFWDDDQGRRPASLAWIVLVDADPPETSGQANAVYKAATEGEAIAAAIIALAHSLG